jgi:D-glycero-alpha-D-manno-heptose-7-phosphate kinase
LKNTTIFKNQSIKTALGLINDNKQGFILVLELDNTILGIATDGDIREKLVSGISLESPIEECTNLNFIWADKNTPRELLIKQLDNNIKFIPLIDENKNLVDIVTRYHMPIYNEESVYIRAKSPVRISFGGGGSDLTHFFVDNNGAVINSTISLYSHATLIVRKDKKVIIESLDLNEKMISDNLQKALSSPGNFKLILSIIKLIHPDFGFELYLHSDFPMKSGLGGSSVVASSILGCFNQLRTDKWDRYEIAELAFQAERLHLDIAGGWQDQYATVFGGFNFMEFNSSQNIIQPLRIDSEILLELEESLVLCNTETIHDSGSVHDDQKKQMGNSNILDLVKENVALTYDMRNFLLRGRLTDFGKSLHKAWLLKRQFSNKISNSELDLIYDYAIINGAIGGKLLGAGGGGFFLFFVPADKKNKLISSLVQNGQKVIPFKFEEKGLSSWTVRSGNNKN